MLTMLKVGMFLLLAYYVFSVLYFRRGFGRFPYRGTVTHPPLVSVVVTARNEESVLPGLLDCLANQTFPVQSTQILLVDDRSTDRTLSLLRAFALARRNVRVLRVEPHEHSLSPKKFAITRAIGQATGEIVLCTDADCLPGPKWIESITGAYDSETGMVLGYAPYRTDRPYDSLFHRLLALEYFAMGAVALATAAMGHPSTCNGANLSFRKRAFQEAGGYGESGRWLSGDDDLLMQRVHTRTKWKIRFAASPDASVPNNPPLRLRDLIVQRIRFSSKHLAYPPKMVAALSGVYAFYTALLVLTVVATIHPGLVPFCCLAWLVKSGVEILFLARGRVFLEKRRLLGLYPLLAPLHLIYVVLFPVLGQLVRPKWK